jgi:hypothetical protein
MEFNLNRYLELVKQQKICWEKGADFMNENRSDCLELIKYEAIIYINIVFQRRSEFILLIERFLSQTITAEHLTYELIRITDEIQILCDNFKTNCEGLKDFEPSFEAIDFYDSLNLILSDCEVFESDAEEGGYTREWLKDSIKPNFLIIQKYL